MVTKEESASLAAVAHIFVVVLAARKTYPKVCF